MSVPSGLIEVADPETKKSLFLFIVQLLFKGKVPAWNRECLGCFKGIFLSVTPRASSPFFQAPERNSACQHLSDFTSSVAMVMYIPAQTGEKVQLQVTMNMNEAQHSPRGEAGLS